MAQPVLVARKKYLAYPVTQEWVDRVRAALDAKGYGEQARMGRAIGAKSNTLADVLTMKKHTSDLVEPIHEYLGWDLPMSPTQVIDSGVGRLAKLTASERRIVFDAVAIAMGEHGEQSRKAAQEMLRALRQAPKND